MNWRNGHPKHRLHNTLFTFDRNSIARKDYSVFIWTRKVAGEHLSFMEEPRHDDVVRIVDIESDQMTGSANRWAV
jgi:hypothetical protein